MLLALCGLLMTTACNRLSTLTESRHATNSGASSPQTAEINFCELVTKADAERVLGESVKETDGNGRGGCAYEITDFGIGRRTVVFSISIESDGKEAFGMHRRMSGVTDELRNVARDDVALNESQREADKRTDSKIQWLSGTRDKAYMKGSFGGGFMGSVMVSVLKNDTWVLVQIIGTPKKGSEEALTAVVKKVANAV